MNNSATKVGEIFTEAGAAFNKLAEMTILIYPILDHTIAMQMKAKLKRKYTEIATCSTSQEMHAYAMPNQEGFPELENETEVETTEVKLEYDEGEEEMVETGEEEMLETTEEEMVEAGEEMVEAGEEMVEAGEEIIEATEEIVTTEVNQVKLESNDSCEINIC